MIALNQIRVPQPCEKDWDAMDGDTQRRLCADCGCHVHDLSAMTRIQAQALLDETQGHICVRYESRPDGTVRTLDAAPAAERSSFGLRRLAAAFWALVLPWTGLSLPARAQAAPHKAAHIKPQPPAEQKPAAPTALKRRRFMGKVVHHQHPGGETGAGRRPPSAAKPALSSSAASGAPLDHPPVVMGAPSPASSMTMEGGKPPKK